MAASDSRLRDLRRLVDRILAERGQEPGASQSHWELPVLPPPDPEGRLTSTDLLSWWFRAPRETTGSWDDYFRDFQASPDPGERDPAPEGAPALDSGRILESLAAPMFPEVEEQLADEHAQAAVDCLYDFLHAMSRRDVDGAMALVAPEYHSMDGDDEVDRLGLRHLLEAHLDSLTGWELEVSLVEAPEPLSHPYGILIATEIQFDAFNPVDDMKMCQVERRVALLRQDQSGEWKIHSLSLVER